MLDIVLLLAVTAFFIRARNGECWGLFWMAVAGSALVYGGWLFTAPISLYGRTALLSAASILNLRKSRDESSVPLSTTEGTSL